MGINTFAQFGNSIKQRLYASKGFILQYIITTVQNKPNLIGQEENNFDRIVISVSILYSLTKKTTFNFRNGKNINVLNTN